MGDTLLWAMLKWQPEKIRLGESACPDHVRRLKVAYLADQV
jgi:hypothetical protein